jgi:hyaluronoglucosaminidase
LLLSKAKQLLFDGATSIALLLDDIPANFGDKFGTKMSEGTYHGILANKLQQKLGQNIYFVPRIYADELIQDEPLYLKDLSNVLDPKIIVFYCGKNVVSKSLTNYKKIKKTLKNRIIFWDNYYANDYCPRRLFVGPYFGRQNIRDIMINPTGLIRTDLLILDIFANNFVSNTSIKEWKKILNLHGVPKNFMQIKNYFLNPYFSSVPTAKTVNVQIEDFEALDTLLWKWKGKLSREWYPFIFGLKHDLQIHKKFLTSERILKTQTIPLSEFLIKGELK